MTHAEQEICLKETEWREVRDFIIGTGEYRMHLDNSINEIKKAAEGTRNLVLAIGLGILIPSIMLWINLGEMKRQIEVNTTRLSVIESQEMQAQAIRSANVARICALEELHRGVK
jgi:signal transduction histidine kinase